MSPRRNWDSPIPSPAIECAHPPPDQRMGDTLASGRVRLRGGGVPIPTNGEKAKHSAYTVDPCKGSC